MPMQAMGECVRILLVFPFAKIPQSLTFERPNIRPHAAETALVMSHAMGRTLVLPPEQRFYLLSKSDQKQKSESVSLRVPP